MSTKNNFNDLESRYTEFLQKTVQEVAVTSEEFFKSRFDKGRDLDGKPYKDRNPDIRPGSRVLVGRGHLRNSIRIKQANLNAVIIQAGNRRVPYAQIHNEGGTIRVTQKMKRYFWALHTKHKRKVKMKQNGKPRASSRGNNKKAEFYKAMALKKAGSVIKIPQRSFIGNSRALTRILESSINKRFEAFANSF